MESAGEYMGERPVSYNLVGKLSSINFDSAKISANQMIDKLKSEDPQIKHNNHRVELKFLIEGKIVEDNIHDINHFCRDSSEYILF